LERGVAVQKTIMPLLQLLLPLCVLFTSLPVGADIFLEAPAAVSPPPANPELVLRQRAVGIDWRSVSFVVDEEIRLNLFEDAALTIVCTAVSDGPGESRLWHGHLAADTSTPITMMLEGGRLSATLTTPGARFKVRPTEANWHVVREIQIGDGAAALWAATATSVERSVWTLTNQERAEYNLAGLSLNGDLVASARAHSADMAAQNYFDHTDLEGGSPGDRIAASGYEARSWGENIAAVYATPQAVVDGWMNSEGHKANILSENFCDIGVGYAYDGESQYGHYWTQHFGRQAGVSECPAVSDDSGDTDDGADDGDGGDAGDDGDDGGDTDDSAGDSGADDSDGEDAGDDGGDTDDSDGDSGSDDSDDGDAAGESASSGSSGGGCFIGTSVGALQAYVRFR
jgi:uncharacterized protein YkwD